MLPSKLITVSNNWTHLNNLQLADPTYYKPEKIDLILGADVYDELIIPEIRRGPVGAPIAQNTTLGWIIIGKIVNPSKSPPPSREVYTHFSEITEDDQLRKFWELEECTDERKPTKADELSDTHYKNTHRRNPDGRYSVDLPFNTENNKPSFGNSRNQALMRFFHLERRLSTISMLYVQYTEFMDEYLRLGHMHVARKSNSASSFYLPLHASS